MKHSRLTGFSLLIIMTLSSCLKEEVKLTKADYKAIDTIFINQDSILSLTADAICDSIWNAQFDISVDSFYDVQMENIKHFYNKDEEAKSN